MLSVSCSKKAGKTDADFKFILGGIASLSNSSGGAMLWGKNNQGASFSINLNAATGDLVLNLKNSTWDFYAIAWDDSLVGVTNAQFTGKPRCAKSMSNVLGGGEVTVDLSLSNANCTGAEFTYATDTNDGFHKFPRVEISSCQTLAGATGGVPCEYDPVGIKTRGFYKSYKVIMPEFIQGDVGGIIPVQSAHLTSECFDVTYTGALLKDSHLTTDNTNVGKINIPTGNSNAPFRTVLRGYYDDNCSSTRGFINDVYELGTFVPGHSSGANINPSLRVDSQNTGFERILLYHSTPPNVACSLSNPAAGDLATGFGSVNEPYGICTPAQFNGIGNDDTNDDGTGNDTGKLSGINSHFQLLADLDFGGYSHLLNQPLGFPNCASIGTSVNPIGGLKYGACGNTITTPTAYSGSFEGHGHLISNAFILEDGHQKIGLFREVGGGGSIKNLRIQNIEVEGQNSTGALIGGITGGTVSVKNIEIRDAYVDGSVGDIGGAIGHMVAGTGAFEDIHVIDSHIDAEGTNIGGVIGNCYGDFTRVSFSGIIELNSNGGTPTGIGGIAGVLQGTKTIAEAKSNGAMIGQFTTAGGLVGEFAGAGTITDSYSNMYIASGESTAPLKLGGLLGMAGSGLVQRSYFSGAISNVCAAADTTCKVGNAIGQAGATTQTIIYSTNTVNSGTLGGAGGSPSTISDFQDGTVFGFINGGGKFAHTAPDLPRLTNWEAPIYDLCLNPTNLQNVATQVGNGRGLSQANPINICSYSQFDDIKTNPSKHYALQNVINLVDYANTGAAIVPTFSGSLDGNGFLLHSLKVTSFTISDYGVFGVIQPSGLIYDTHFGGALLMASGSEDRIGVIAGTNHGQILKSSVVASVLQGNNQIGGVVGVNSPTGLIYDVINNFSVNISGVFDVGGIAGKNEGNISKVAARGQMAPASVTHNEVGGIVGRNTATGKIEQASSSMSIMLANSSTNIGGIVGINDGEVEDVIATKYSFISSTATSTKVGGIVGTNDTNGQIERALSVTNIELNSSPTNLHGPIVGDDLGSIDNFTFYGTKPYNPAFNTANSINSGVVNGNECDINLGGATAVGVNDFIYINPDKDVMYKVTFVTDTFNITVSLDNSTTCAGFTSTPMTEVIANTANDLPNVTQYVPSDQLKDLGTYCLTPLSGSLSFVCLNGWDIVEDDPFGNGGQFLRDIFENDLYNLPPPAGGPVWTIRNDGTKYPELIFDW